MQNLKEVRVPDLGGSRDVPVIELLVKVGDRIAVDQGIIMLESDKATMEAPSSVAGVVKEWKVRIGDTLSEGDVIALIETAEAAVDVTVPDAATLGDEAEAEAAPSPMTATATPVEKALAEDTEAFAGGNAAFVMPGKVPYASPAVRRLARELDVELSRVIGSGRNGRIVRGDVEAHAREVSSVATERTKTAVSPTSGAGPTLLPWPSIDFAKFGAVEMQSLSRIQKLSAANLWRNWVVVPHVTQHDRADITELEALRLRLNQEFEKSGIKFTMLAFLIKAAAALLKQFSRFNASLDTDGETLTLKKYCHIGFAADTPQGLVVPVLRDADQKGLSEIARETAALAAKARDGKLTPAEMQGGCFSISSLGGIGGTAFTPIVNVPEVAILGVSKSSIEPVWDGSAFQPRLLLPLSLSYDHRVIDGAAAARFTAELARLLGDFRRVLL